MTLSWAGVGPSPRWGHPALALLLLLAATLTTGCRTILRATPPEERATLTLTFDDGPSPSVTDRILDVLARHGVKAYFCLIGENVRASAEHEELTRRIEREGHVIVNHGDTATWATRRFTAAGVAAEIAACDATLARVLGHERPTRWYRPGGGWIWAWQLGAVARAGKTILPLDRYDWDALYSPITADRLQSELLAGIETRGLGWIVIHDGMNGQAELARRMAESPRYDRSFVPELVDALITGAREAGLEVRSAVAAPPTREQW
ncbi:polysaccharide deacetylase family protein [Engelhardtia mirabilis]|uniref:polysaccharide deacetylase family protein n=1 Tax=Engelhardtia mirabilis TaxID=2528011 RepID=UPI003AF37077